MHWKQIFLLICIYGIFKKFLPGWPFLAPFLESNSKNFTNTQVNSQILPYSSYGDLFISVPLLLFVDKLRYQPVIVFQSICLLLVFVLLVFGNTLFQMQTMQFCYGLYIAADVAYGSYLYAVVDQKHFKMTTSYKRSATMFGQFLANCLGQFLISTGMANYLFLNKLTILVSITNLFIATILPMPEQKVKKKHSSYLLNGNGLSNGKFDEFSSLLQATKYSEIYPNNSSKNFRSSNFLNNFWNYFQKYILTHFQDAIVFKWSLWIILFSCFLQPMFYVQTLWALQQQEGSQLWNGLVEGINTLFAAIGIFSLQFINFQWELHSLKVYTLASVIFATILYAMIYCQFIYLSYLLYILLHTLFEMMMTLSVNVVAAHITTGKYGLVFGIISLASVFGRSLLTFTLIDKNGLFALTIYQQFNTYSLLLCGIPVLFYVMEKAKK